MLLSLSLDAHEPEFVAVTHAVLFLSVTSSGGVRMTMCSSSAINNPVEVHACEGENIYRLLS